MEKKPSTMRCVSTHFSLFFLSMTNSLLSTPSRDRLTFSKSILKRYIRECVQRESPVGSPWVVKPVIAAAFGISTYQSEEDRAKDQVHRDSKLAKRRKVRSNLPFLKIEELIIVFPPSS